MSESKSIRKRPHGGAERVVDKKRRRIGLSVSDMPVHFDSTSQYALTALFAPIPKPTPKTPSESKEVKITVEEGYDLCELKLVKPVSLRPSLKEVLPVATAIADPAVREGILNMLKSSLGAGKVFRAKLGVVISMSSNGSGYVNASVPVSNVSTSTGFTSFAVLFDEFFVTKMTSRWMPRSRYQGNLTWGVGSEESNASLGCANLHHGATAYSTPVTNMVSNAGFKYHSTGDPFTYTWNNVEDPKAGTVVGPQTTPALPTQSWCLTVAAMAAAYTGLQQFMSQASGTVLVASKVLGDFAVEFQVLFRTRV